MPTGAGECDKKKCAIKMALCEEKSRMEML